MVCSYIDEKIETWIQDEIFLISTGNFVYWQFDVYVTEVWEDFTDGILASNCCGTNLFVVLYSIAAELNWWSLNDNQVIATLYIKQTSTQICNLKLCIWIITYVLN